MDNPYAPPEAEVVEKKDLDDIVLSKKVNYEKYRDEVKSFIILFFSSSFFLLPGFHFLFFAISAGFCVVLAIVSYYKMKEAKLEYEAELGHKL